MKILSFCSNPPYDIKAITDQFAAYLTAKPKSSWKHLYIVVLLIRLLARVFHTDLLRPVDCTEDSDGRYSVSFKKMEEDIRSVEEFLASLKQQPMTFSFEVYVSCNPEFTLYDVMLVWQSAK